MKITPSATGVRLSLPAGTRELLTTAAGQLGDLLEDPGAPDPALIRLLPDAYRDDAAAAEEFRHLTQDDLLERKRSDARLVVRTAFDKALDVEGAEAWLRSLTDVRLVLAQRLGISRDGEAEELLEHGDAETRQVVTVMAHLAWVQELLIQALGDGGF